MEMCYDGALVMPNNYAVVDEEEMTYVDGGLYGYKEGTASSLKNTVGGIVNTSGIVAIASGIIAAFSGFGAVIPGVIAGGVSAYWMYSWWDCSRTVYHELELIIQRYGSNRMCYLETTCTGLGFCTGMTVSLK